MLLNYTYYELTIFTTNDLAVGNNCVGCKLVYSKIFSFFIHLIFNHYE